jgi:hypothetical protein
VLGHDELGLPGVTEVRDARIWPPLLLPAAAVVAAIAAGALSGSVTWGWVAAGGLAGLSLSGSP